MSGLRNTSENYPNWLRYQPAIAFGKIATKCLKRPISGIFGHLWGQWRAFLAKNSHFGTKDGYSWLRMPTIGPKDGHSWLRMPAIGDKNAHS